MIVERKPRYAHLKFHVVYDDQEGFMTAPVLNLSESGVFLETVMPLAPGTRVRMTPLLSESAGLFELDGEVVRASVPPEDASGDRAPGMGIRFIDMTEEKEAELRRLFEETRRAGASTPR